MKDIDWSKAPEDATHCVPEEYLECAKCWIKFDGVIWFYCYPDAYPGWKLWPKTSVDKASHLFIERPKEQAWSGEGLPTVGTVCEVRMVGTCYWGKARIKYITKAVCVFAYVFEDDSDELEEYSQFTCNLSFRPIKTQEQIAAEEREKAIHEMWMQVTTDCGDTIGIQKRACADLYDAGYRLTKTEE